MKDGTIAGGAYAKMRRSILKTEEMVFLPDGRVDMKLCGWLG
jgi:methylated-DNA-protein-cysteine methyltransferase-like protein